MAPAAMMAGFLPKALETLRRRRVTCTPASSTPFARPGSLTLDSPLSPETRRGILGVAWEHVVADL
jgi:hypothetical protein